MEPYHWFLVGMMAGFIPCFVALVMVVTGTCGYGIRRRGPDNPNHS
jgi:hypothetical protein